MEVSSQANASAALPLRRPCDSHWICCVGSRKNWRRVKLFTLPGIEPRFVGSPALSIVAIPAGLAGFYTKKWGTRIICRRCLLIDFKAHYRTWCRGYLPHQQTKLPFPVLLFFMRVVVTDVFFDSHCLHWHELQHTNLTFSFITGTELPYASMKYFIFYWCWHKPYQGGRGSTPSPHRNSEVLRKSSRIPCSMENTSVTT
jgi:hypothetical protein